LTEQGNLKAAYRLLENPEVTHENVIEAHINKTREKCCVPGEYLLIEGTTTLSFSQRSKPVAGLGPLTHDFSQGLLVHTCLATRVECWTDDNKPEVSIQGLLGQVSWARQEPEGSRKERKNTKRRAKRAGEGDFESARWSSAIHECGPPPEHARWTLVADRECDIFQVLVNCGQNQCEWIIRASQARRTTSPDGNIFQALARGHVLGRFTQHVRARPGVAARDAQVEVRAVQTEILAPKDLSEKPAPQATWLVEVREIEPPEDGTPLHWVLLTSWPCNDFAQARRVVSVYATRWLVEEYHKALKTGTNIEDSQLSSAGRIKALLGIHAVIAVDLLQLKLLATTHGDDPVDEELLLQEARIILEGQFGPPDNAWSNAYATRAIARMGGYLNRKNDGPPGWLSIWRGWMM
jgi:hypothetical protein